MNFYFYHFLNETLNFQLSSYQMKLKMFTVYSLVCFQIYLLIEVLINRGKELLLDAAFEKVQSKFVTQRKIQVPMVVDTQTRFTQQIVVDNLNKARLCSNLGPKKSFKSNISTFSSYSSLPPSTSSSSLPSLSVSTISLPGSLGNYESISPPLQSNTKLRSTRTTKSFVPSSPLYSYSSPSLPENLKYPSISMSSSLATLNYLNSSQPMAPISHKRRHEKHHQQQAKSKCDPIKVHRSKLIYLQPLCSKHYLHITGKTVRATKTSHIIDNAFHITGMAIRGKKSREALVKFQSLNSEKFICFNKKGKIIAKENGEWDLSCIFREYLSNGPSFKYQSYYNNNWYLGFDHKGRPIRGTVNRHERRKYGSRRLKISRHCYEFSKINIKQTI